MKLLHWCIENVSSMLFFLFLPFIGNVMPISGVAAGATGSPFVTKLTFTSVATGNYVINNTNFAGVGPYIPGWILVVPLTAANVTWSASNDNGTTWNANSATGPVFLYVDSGSTTRINIATGATTIVMFPMGR